MPLNAVPVWSRWWSANRRLPRQLRVAASEPTNRPLISAGRPHGPPAPTNSRRRSARAPWPSSARNARGAAGPRPPPPPTSLDRLARPEDIAQSDRSVELPRTGQVGSNLERVHPARVSTVYGRMHYDVTYVNRCRAPCGWRRKRSRQSSASTSPRSTGRSSAGSSRRCDSRRAVRSASPDQLSIRTGKSRRQR